MVCEIGEGLRQSHVVDTKERICKGRVSTGFLQSFTDSLRRIWKVLHSVAGEIKGEETPGFGRLKITADTECEPDPVNVNDTTC